MLVLCNGAGDPAPSSDGAPRSAVDSGSGGLLSRFTELRIAQVRIAESVRVRRPTDSELSFLQLDEGRPVVEIRHTGWAADGRAVEVGFYTVPASGWILDFEWSLD
jgi:UTRA domain